jgi:hypothetical protein
MNKFKEVGIGRTYSVYVLIISMYTIFDCKHGMKMLFGKPIRNLEFDEYSH